MNRLTRQHGDGYDESYLYDSNGNLTEIHNGGTNIRFVYNSNNQLVLQTDSHDGHSSHTYDNAGRLIRMVDDSIAIDLKRDSKGRTTEISISNGSKEQIRYDALDQVIERTIYTRACPQCTLLPSDQIQYSYDENGNLIKKNHNGTIFHYLYDNNNRLLQGYAANGAREQYHYDKQGNMEEKTQGSTIINQYFDQSNRLIEQRYSTGQTINHHYDLRGLKTHTEVNGEETVRYHHDGLGRLIGISSGQDSLHFTYDGTDRRISTEIKQNGQQLQYRSIYDSYQENSRHEQLQLKEDGKPLRRITWLPNDDGSFRLIAQVRYSDHPLINPTDMPMQTDGLDVFHTDNLNSVIAISNHQGKLRAQINYSSWGDIEKNSLLEQHPYFAPGLFTSRFREGISHLTHMDARWYNAETGRFIEPDLYNITALLLPQAIRSEVFEQVDNRLQTLLRDPQQQLRYSYVSNNPLRWVDLSGLKRMTGKEAADYINKGIDGVNDAMENLFGDDNTDDTVPDVPNIEWNGLGKNADVVGKIGTGIDDKEVGIGVSYDIKGNGFSFTSDITVSPSGAVSIGASCSF